MHSGYCYTKNSTDIISKAFTIIKINITVNRIRMT